MISTKTMAEAQQQAPLAPVAARLPEGSEKSAGTSYSFTSNTAASSPPTDGKSAMRTTQMVANGGSRQGAAPLAQLMSQLQRSVGNARVSSLIGRKIQTKLNVSTVDDPSEREADHVSEAVTRQRSEPSGSVQRELAYPLARLTNSKQPSKAEAKPETELHAASTIQRAATSRATGEHADAKMESRIKSPSGGQRLPGKLQKEMEGHLGADFSQVRVHDSATDQADAGRLNAKAFTHGADIWLGAGASVDDRKLMAHELTHVAQQTGAGVSRMPAIQRTLAELDDELDDVFVDEDLVIDLLQGLSAAEKSTVLAGTHYRDLIASALNVGEMVRALKNLDPPLEVKLEWVEAAAWFTRSIDYSDIQNMVTDATQPERDALKTTRWRDFFLKVCTNDTILTAVDDLKFDLVTKLEWIKEEASTWWLDYPDIQKMVTDATQPERDKLNTDDWREFFIDVCVNKTILLAVVDLKFELVRKLEWVEEEASTLWLDYSDIQKMITDALQPERNKLKTDHWRDFFVGVCTDKTMADAVNDLGWNLKERMDWMHAEDPSANPQQVNFTDSTNMTYGGDGPQAKPIWEAGDSADAVAYVMGSNPKTTAQFEIEKELERVIGKPITVRVSASGTIVGTKTGLTVGKGTLDVTDLQLKGLPGSATVNDSTYKLTWELSEDGTVWAPLGETGEHVVYWLLATPVAAPLDSRAAAKATKYAKGLSDAGAVANAIRHGPRGVDSLAYKPDVYSGDHPLSLYDTGVGLCTNYANLLTYLALSVGLNANAVFLFGGFQTMGKNVWMALSGAYGTTLVNVKSPVPGYNKIMLPGISPAGWAFTFHAISRIEGTLQDAALDRTGIDAEAVHAGKSVRLVEPGAAGVPDAGAGTPYNQRIPRKDHPIEVSLRDYGQTIPDSAFSADKYALEIAAAEPSPVEMIVDWSLTGGALPPGLTLDKATGRISGTPTAPGRYAFDVKMATPDGKLANVVSLTITVT